MLDEVLSNWPPLFHRWQLGNFTEPAAWLNARLAYTRTAGGRHGTVTGRFSTQQLAFFGSGLASGVEEGEGGGQGASGWRCVAEPANAAVAVADACCCAGVWSMVGHMVGLGDRHGENILVSTMLAAAC